MELALAVVVVLLIILVLYQLKCSETNENFDVYNNHTEGAQSVYAAWGIPGDSGPVKLTIPQTRLVAKYSWNDKDILGYDVYDRYYDDLVLNRNRDAVDYKQTFNPFRLPGGGYSVQEMIDTDPFYTVVNGEYVVLSQKK